VRTIRMAVVAALVASTLSLQPATALAQEHHKRDRHEDRRDDNDRRHDDRSVPYDRRNDDDRRIDVRRGYDAARYYRSGRGYQPYRLGRNDRIYRGYDDRYYCRRDDGTTGLIVGAMAGGVLGHVIAPGGYKTLGTILGAGGGALIGRAIDDGVECR